MNEALSESEVCACMYIIQHGSKARAAKVLGCTVRQLTGLLASAQTKLGVTIFSFHSGKASAMVAKSGFTKLHQYQQQHGGYWNKNWDGRNGFVNDAMCEVAYDTRSRFSPSTMYVLAKGSK